MPPALADVLRRVRALAAERKLRFTLKAVRELAALGLDATDACESLEGLKAADFVKRLVSEATGEWMYVFKPNVGGIPVYVKLILRRGCLVVSFHEDEGGDEEEGH
jgi:Motility quorum-sensing regulator, toxin of MqsA